MPGDIATAGTAGAGVTQSAAGGPEHDGVVSPGAGNGVTPANGARADQAAAAADQPAVPADQAAVQIGRAHG